MNSQGTQFSAKILSEGTITGSKINVNDVLSLLARIAVIAYNAINDSISGAGYGISDYPKT